MNRTAIRVSLILLLILAVGVAVWHAVSSRRAQVAEQSEPATATPDLTGQQIYVSGTYGFTIRYPEIFQTDPTFTSFYHLPANWRVNAAPEGTGTPVIAIIGNRLQSDNSYPRYFDAEVRIGVSSNPVEVARCMQGAIEQGEQELPNLVLGGSTFKAYSFQSAGMMQYLKGISYRTVHNGACYAIEQLETGSSYRDDPASARDIPDDVLTAKYNALSDVVKSFSFTAQ